MNLLNSHNVLNAVLDTMDSAVNKIFLMPLCIPLKKSHSSVNGKSQGKMSLGHCAPLSESLVFVLFPHFHLYHFFLCFCLKELLNFSSSFSSGSFLLFRFHCFTPA